MAEYLTLSCQCRSRYTHPFTADYLTLIFHAERQVKAAKNHQMPVMGQNAPECTGRRKRSHICDKMTATCRSITQHKLVYRKILLNMRTLPPNRDSCYYVCHFKAIS